MFKTRWCARVSTSKVPVFVLLLLLAGIPSAAPDARGTVRADAIPSQSPMNNSIFRTFGAMTDASYANWDFTYTAQAEQHALDKGIRDNRVPLYWSSNQPKAMEKAYFDWTVDDSIVATMANAKLLGMIGNNIDWSAHPCTLPGGCTAPTQSIDGMLTPTRPALAGTDPQWSDWDIYVYKTVSRYGPHANGQGSGYGQNRITTWQVMNEIDNTRGIINGIPGTGNTDAEISARGQTYGQILARTTQIIKLADPTALIISCGLSDYYPGESAPNQTIMLPRTKLFIDSVAATGAYNGVDGFAVHAYWAMATDGGISMKQYLENYQQELVRVTGKSIPLWITEAGSISNSLGQDCGPGCNVSFETETRMVIQNLTQILGNSVTAALYWFNLNTNAPQMGATWYPDSFALAKPCNGSPDWIESARGSALYAFKRTVFDKGYTFISYQSTQDVSFFVFGNGSDYLHILWTKSTATVGFTNLDATTFGHLSIADDLGDAITPGSSPTNATLTLSQEPLFLSSPTQLDLSTLTVSPGPPLTQRSVGYVRANCDAITGWACNASDFTRPLTIGLFDGDRAQGKVIAYLTANQLTGNAAIDTQIAGNCGGFGGRTFSVATPAWLKTTGPHTITAYAVNLDGSPASQLLDAGPNATTFNCVNGLPPPRPTAPLSGPTPPALPISRPGVSPVPGSPEPLPIHR
ncbi:MAG: glycoside hydrolase 5 family protein [Thermomicrobiales bacterium]